MRSFVCQARLIFPSTPFPQAFKLDRWFFDGIVAECNRCSLGANQENVNLVRKASPHLGLL